MIHKEAYMVSTSRICDVHDMEEHYLKLLCVFFMVITQVVLQSIAWTLHRFSLPSTFFAVHVQCLCRGDSGWLPNKLRTSIVQLV